MKAWEELTDRGRFRRLRALAAAALARYPIDVERLSLVGGFANAIYRVDTRTGPYALRIDLLQEHDDESTAVELAWLDALGGEPDLDVCRPVRTHAGELVVRERVDGVPDARRCVLFEWVPGRPLHHDLRPARYRQLGAASARLHRHGAQFVPPHRPMAWDRTFYWPSDVDPVVYDRPEHAHHFAGGRAEVLEAAMRTVERAFHDLDPAGAQVIHADLHPWNVHVVRDRLIVIDFEDVAWAHPVQDLAITLYYEQRDPAYPELRAALRAGYEAEATWPERTPGEIDHFIAARTLMFVNYVLNLRGDPEEFYAAAFPRLERFVDTWS